MSKYEQFMQLMEKKGKIRTMQVAKQLTPELPGIPADLQKQIDKGCVATSINALLSTDHEIKSAFDKAAYELMLDKIFNDLELKKDPEFKATPQEELAKIIAQSIFGDAITGFGK